MAQTIVLLVKVHWPNGYWSPAGGIEFPLAFLVGAFAVQVLGPGSWALDAYLPVEVLYEPNVKWLILGLAVAGALVAAFWPTAAPPSEVAEGPSTTEAAPE